MLKNYDYFYKNENCVKVNKFEYEKDDKKWRKGRYRTKSFRMGPWCKPSGYSLVNEGNNLYDYTRECFFGHLSSVTVDLNGDDFVTEFDDQTVYYARWQNSSFHYGAQTKKTLHMTGLERFQIKHILLQTLM